MTTVYAFDRDQTIDVNPPPEREAVPLTWLHSLRERENVEVWAIGNQRLRYEAEIPGVPELLNRLESVRLQSRLIAGMMWIEWHFHRYPGLRTMFAKSAPHVDSTLLPTREERLELIREHHRDATTYIVVDDIDRSDADGWRHYFPWEFVEAVADGSLDIEIDIEV